MLRFSKSTVFILSSLPAIVLIYRGITGRLGANPIEEITHFTGDWTIYFLLITLSVTPLRRLTGLHVLIRFRRMLGLFAFFYACLHFTTYLLLDQFFDWHAIFEDVLKRPYITVGFAAFLLMIPLAITSNGYMMRKLGNRWHKLHKCVYLVTGLGLLHYYWLVKADIRTPILLAVIFLLLMTLRLPWLMNAKKLLIPGN